MSADEFDPQIERLFAQSPSFPDAAVFAHSLEARLERTGRLRTLAVTVAGVVGGVVAVSQGLGSNLSLTADAGEAARVSNIGLANAATRTQQAVEAGLADFGVNLDLASAGGMPIFWLGAALLIAVALTGAMRLSQEL